MTLRSPGNSRILIAPSILAADFARLGEEVRRAERAGADWLHVDVMDGHFVPNLTMGPVVVEGLRRATRKFLDVHLMVDRPWDYVESFARAGADRRLVHVEAMVAPAKRVPFGRAPAGGVPQGWSLPGRPLPRAALARARATLQDIRRRGCRAGLALNPGTPAGVVEPLLGEVDLVLPMTVWPGFGGQAFLDSVLPKVARLRKMGGSRLRVEVDGGLNPETAARAAAAGADVIVAGTAAFRARDMRAAIRALRAAAAMRK